jgi:cell division protein FtsL
MSLFNRKVRGFRLVDVVAAGLLVAIILSVYLAKTMAGRERAEIATVEKQIDAERARIRLLKAEVAHLEQPGRIEQLSVAHLGMAPVDAKHEATPEDLAKIAALGKVVEAKAAVTAAPMTVVAAASPAAQVTKVAQVVTTGPAQVGSERQNP